MLVEKTHVVARRLHPSLRLRLVVDGVLIGLVCGSASVGYRALVGLMENWRGVLYAQRGLLIVAVLGLLFLLGSGMGWLLKRAPYSGGSGIPQIRAELMGRIHMDVVWTFISKLFGGAFAALGGLSLGREGPSIQIGGLVAKGLGHLLKKDEVETNYMITAGASAGLSAAFNAPIAGALFALEEMHKSFSPFLMLPVLLSSIVANALAFFTLGVEPAFSFRFQQVLPMSMAPVIVAVGILCGLMGALYNKGIMTALCGFDRIKLPKPVVLGLLMVLSYPIGRWMPEVLGGGHHMVEEMTKGGVGFFPLFSLVAVNLVFTWICFGSGAQGGIFLPTLVLGAGTGQLVYLLLSPYLPLDGYGVNFIILGMVGVLTAVVRAPILSILLIMEMTASFTHLISISTVAYVSFLVAELIHSEPVYESLYERLVARLRPEPVVKQHFLVTSYRLSSLCPHLGTPLHRLHFPCHLVILTIHREGEEFFPSAKTRLCPGDELLVYHAKEDTEAIDEYFRTEGDVIASGSRDVLDEEVLT